MREQDVQYARQASDATLKQKGQFEDSIRLNRRSKRKQKDGIHTQSVSITIEYRTEDTLKEREVAYNGLTAKEHVEE